MFLTFDKMAGRFLVSAAAVLPFVYAHPSSVQPRQACVGVQGFDRGTPAIGYYASSIYATPEGCAAKCRTAASCTMFGVSTTECLIYSTTVATNVIPSPDSAYTFFDLYCFTPTPAPASTPASVPAQLCGAKGYDKQAPRSFFSSVGATVTPEACASQCATTIGTVAGQCLSYAVVGTTGCLFYNQTFVSGGGATNAPYVTNLVVDPASQYSFYDQSCPLTGTALYPACNTIEGCVEGRICTLSGGVKYQQYCAVELDPVDAAVWLYTKAAATTAPQTRLPGWIVDACAVACEANPECKGVRLSQALGETSVQCRLVKTATPRYQRADGARDLYQVLSKLA